MLHPRLLIVPFAALVLSACIVVPNARQGDYYEPTGAESAAPPPAPYVEVVPVMPFVGALWIGGYWGWSGNRHQWMPGRWEQPRQGYGWRPHAWVQHGGRWREREGGWQRR